MYAVNDKPDPDGELRACRYKIAQLEAELAEARSIIAEAIKMIDDESNEETSRWGNMLFDVGGLCEVLRG
jgi:hypothetical protein